ncbi:MAG: hypothetical protein GOP50_08000 [Candidatus Heimdallarchaeota archaeon]|nr:hypothetical protein [Candidatus Heimdallarchaeota archaeon]
MTKFKVIRMVNQRPTRYPSIAAFMQDFENTVQEYLDAGWIIINCDQESFAMYAFLQKD